MKDDCHCTTAVCPETRETLETVSIEVSSHHPLLQLKRALPWVALFESRRRTVPVYSWPRRLSSGTESSITKCGRACYLRPSESYCRWSDRAHFRLTLIVLDVSV